MGLVYPIKMLREFAYHLPSRDDIMVSHSGWGVSLTRPSQSGEVGGLGQSSRSFDCGWSLSSHGLRVQQRKDKLTRPSEPKQVISYLFERNWRKFQDNPYSLGSNSMGSYCMSSKSLGMNDVRPDLSDGFLQVQARFNSSSGTKPVTSTDYHRGPSENLVSKVPGLPSMLRFAKLLQTRRLQFGPLLGARK